MANSTPLRRNKRACVRPTPNAVDRFKDNGGSNIKNSAHEVESPPRIDRQTVLEGNFPTAGQVSRQDESQQPPPSAALCLLGATGHGCENNGASQAPTDDPQDEDKEPGSGESPILNQSPAHRRKNPRPPQPVMDADAFEEGEHWKSQRWLKKAFPFHSRCGQHGVPPEELLAVDILRRGRDVRAWRRFTSKQQVAKLTKLRAARKKAKKVLKQRVREAKEAEQQRVREEKTAERKVAADAKKAEVERKKTEKVAERQRKKAEKAAEKQRKQAARRSQSQRGRYAPSADPPPLNTEDRSEAASTLLSLAGGGASAPAAAVTAAVDGRYAGMADSSARRNEKAPRTAAAKAARRASTRKKGDPMKAKSSLKARPVVRARDSVFRRFFNLAEVSKKPDKDAKGQSTEGWQELVPVLILIDPVKRNPGCGGTHRQNEERHEQQEVIVLSRDKDESFEFMKDVLRHWEEMEDGVEDDGEQLHDGYKFRFFSSLDAALAMDGVRKRPTTKVPTMQENIEDEDEFDDGVVSEDDIA